MKTLSILLLFAACSHLSFSQKCKYKIERKDAFSGETMRGIMENNSGVIWTSLKKGDKYLIEFTFLHAGDVEKPMTTKDSLLVKLADGAVLHLHPSTDVQPVRNTKAVTTTTSRTTSGQARTTATNAMDITQFSPMFQVERSVYEKLANSGIQAVRIDFTGKPLDFDFMRKPLSKSVENIMNNSKCILALP